MSNVVISVDRLSKRYRIGLPTKRVEGVVQRSLQTIASPLNYLRTTLREPNPEEILWALRDVSFEVNQGEVVGIIGKNGAGKSTLLKILTRITDPSDGRATIRGRVGSMLEVGTGFHPELTGRENVYMNGTILGMTRAEIDRKFDEIVEFSGVEQFLDTPVKRYSSGMTVRLAFAVAAHLDPEVLLIDEVLAVGDAQFQKKSLGKMSNVAQSGRTILFVSHNMVALQSLCERVIWLSDGEIIANGRSDEVISAYLKQDVTETRNQIWDDPDNAPGNESVRLRRIAIEPNEGSSDRLTNDSPMRVVVEYDNLLGNDDLLDITLQFHDEFGIGVFSTSTIKNDVEWAQKNKPIGRFQSICYIPGFLFNTRAYFVSLLFVANESRVLCKIDRIMHFEVQESGDLLGAWYGKPIGVVRPKLQWVTEHVGSNTDMPVLGKV